MESGLTIANLAKVKAISEEDVYVTRRYSVKGDKSTMKELEKEYTVYKINAMDEALKLGNSKVFNIIVLGMAAKHMDFSKEDWLKVIEKTVPPKTVEINKKAFLLGFEGGC